MTFKKKEQNPVPTQNPEDTVQLAATTTQNPVVAVKKPVIPCSVSADSAKDAMDIYFNNKFQEIVAVKTNQFGGIVLEFQDKISKKTRMVALNREGLVDVLRFGFQAISENR